MHIESKKGHFRNTAKFWLEPKVEIANKGNFSDSELNLVGKLIEENRDLIVNQIEKYFKGEDIKIIKL